MPRCSKVRPRKKLWGSWRLARSLAGNNNNLSSRGPRGKVEAPGHLDAHFISASSSLKEGVLVSMQSIHELEEVHPYG